MLRRLLRGIKGATGPGAHEVVMLGGDSMVEAVGENHYQKELSSICGGKTHDGHQLDVIAILDPEPDNPYDSNAVAIRVQGKKVAHLARSEAARLQGPIMQLRRSTGKHVGCRAQILGGWDRGDDDQGHFGIRLHFDKTALSSP